MGDPTTQEGTFKQTLQEVGEQACGSGRDSRSSSCPSQMQGLTAEESLEALDRARWDPNLHWLLRGHQVVWTGVSRKQ